MVCYAKEPGRGCSTGHCAIAIQDAEWRRNKERARMRLLPALLPSGRSSACCLPPLPASLVSSMMAPFVLTTTDDDDRGEKGRKERGGERGRADGLRSKEDGASSLLLRQALRHLKCDLCSLIRLK